VAAESIRHAFHPNPPLRKDGGFFASVVSATPILASPAYTFPQKFVHLGSGLLQPERRISGFAKSSRMGSKSFFGEFFAALRVETREVVAEPFDGVEDLAVGDRCTRKTVPPIRASQNAVFYGKTAEKRSDVPIVRFLGCPSAILQSRIPTGERLPLRRGTPRQKRSLWHRGVSG
jgi:hypothetical protein